MYQLREPIVMATVMVFMVPDDKAYTVRHQVVSQVMLNVSASSTVVMQLAYCPGKQGKPSEYCLQNLRNDVMADSVLVHVWLGSHF